MRNALTVSRITIAFVLLVASLTALITLAVFGQLVRGEDRQQLVVTTGSMEPSIPTGSWILDKRIPTEAVKEGQVLSLQSAVTGKTVTHRVVSIDHTGGQTTIRMKGDANENRDGETYIVGASVYTPVAMIPGAGPFIAQLTSPRGTVSAVALISISALLGLVLLLWPLIAPTVGGPRQAALPETNSTITIQN